MLRSMLVLLSWWEHAFLYEKKEEKTRNVRYRFYNSSHV